MSILNLKPEIIWKNFTHLNSVPRPSKQESQVIELMLAFGKRLGLETSRDEIGNVLIKKPATSGMENRQTIILQAHLDMVCQKNNDREFDFNRQAIEMRMDGEWVKANGTTLGADNGLGVAAIMSILESTDIPHPNLEALFTIDEETGMTGAQELKPNWLTGKILLNLDTEEDDEITIGCAGGVDVSAEKTFNHQTFDGQYFSLKIKGLQGGHSGVDIHRGFGNANKILARFLNLGLNYSIQLAQINGGGLRNAIPREAEALFIVADFENYEKQFLKLKQEIESEYQTIEKQLNIELKTEMIANEILSAEDSKNIIRALNAVPNGVFRMSPDVPDLVEASNNLARVELNQGNFSAHHLSRSSVESTKMAVVENIQAVFELANIPVSYSGSYIGWKPEPHAEILKIAIQQYEALFNHQPKVVACHAGLECGIIGGHYPELEMLSFGPTIKGAHSPDERVNIASVEKFWLWLQAILKNSPPNK